MNQWSREIWVASVLAALLALLAVFAPAFYAPMPLLSRCSEQAPALIMTVGMALLIIARQIDVSVGSQFAVCAVIAGTLTAAKAPLVIAVATAIAAGGAMGALNGLLVAGLGLPSIVVTLATMATWEQALRLFQQGRFVALPEGTQWWGLGQTMGQWTLIAAACLITAAFAVAMKHTSGGRRVYAVGSDAESALLAGIDPRKTVFRLFILMGLLAGLAAALNIVRSPQVDPKAGLGLELKVIAAVVVGGVAVSGGRGSVWGASVGLLLLATINPALTYLHVDAYWEKATQGVVILAALIADSLKRRTHAGR